MAIIVYCRVCGKETNWVQEGKAFIRCAICKCDHAVLVIPPKRRKFAS
jgi:hypothetical protein